MRLRLLTGLLILAILVVVVPSLRDLLNCFYLGAHTICILLFMLSIWLVFPPIPARSICIAVAVHYRRNLSLTLWALGYLFYSGYISTVNSRKDNTILQKAVQRHMQCIFQLRLDFSLYDQSKPGIIVANYCQDRLENLAAMLVPGNITIMMRDGLKPVLGRIVKWTLITKEKNSYESTKKSIMNSISEGRPVFTYATKYQKIRPEWVFKIRSGVFHIAKELNLPITLMAIDWIRPGPLGALTDQTFGMKSSSPFYVDDVQSSMHQARLFFSETFRKFAHNK